MLGPPDGSFSEGNMLADTHDKSDVESQELCVYTLPKIDVTVPGKSWCMTSNLGDFAPDFSVQDLVNSVAVCYAVTLRGRPSVQFIDRRIVPIEQSAQ